MFYGCRVNEHERRLAMVVEGILASYREHGNINHLDGGGAAWGHSAGLAAGSYHNRPPRK